MNKSPKVVIHVLKLQTPEISKGRWNRYLIKLINTGGYLDTTRHLFLLDSSPLPPSPAEPLTYWQRERMLNDWLDATVRRAAANESEYRKLRPHAQVRGLFRTHGGYSTHWLMIWVDSWSVWPSISKKRDVTVYVPKEMLPYKGYCRRAYTIPKEPAPVVWKKPDWRGTGSIDEPIAYRLGAWHACKAQYPHAYQTVDIALLSEDESGVWLGRKDNEAQWRFFGGFTDPSDASLEAAARRELLEESGVEKCSNSDMEYVMSERVDDWRYKGQQDTIITALFLTHVSEGDKIVPNDDIYEVAFFKFSDIRMDSIVEEHQQPLMRLMQKLNVAKLEESNNEGNSSRT